MTPDDMSNPHTPEAVLFDLDGTLLDTLEDLGSTVNRVLEARGFPIHPMASYRYFVGDGSRMLIIRALPEPNRDEATIGECHRAFLEDYGQNWHVKTRPYEGINGMLDALEARGLKMAILSNKVHRFTLQCVERFFPGRPFDVVFGQREGVPRKPDPAAAIEIAGKLGLPPGRFLYLGDTPVDMKTAHGAGMRPIGVLWGFRGREELLNNGAERVIRTPGELLDVL